MTDQEIVVRLAGEVHANHWQMSGNVSTGDQLATLITSTWQKRLQEAVPGRFEIEYKIAPHLNQRIDVVDVVNGITYELKVSPNNVHMEFYRDIFKVILARDNRLPNLTRFVFLTPENSAAKLKRGMGQAVIDDSGRLGLTIDVIGLTPREVASILDNQRSVKIAEIEKQLEELKKLVISQSMKQA